jgi:serine protease Do
MKSKLLIAGVAAIAAIASGIGIYYAKERSVFSHASANSAPPQEAVTTTQPSAAVVLPDFSGLVAKYGPAVVNISVTRTEKTAGIAPFPPDEDNPFFWFFRHFEIPMPRGEIPMHGLGSGFIVSPDGVILTNAHVVAGASEVTVKLTDRREFKARIVGIDKPTDVAVLKIDAVNLPSVKIGDPAEVKVGEWVLAIGSPFGFENSVTAGIVSAKYRSLPGDSYVPFIQTDVAVNPGNSGGPLFNMNGEVIGINSQIYTRSGGYQGLSFAIPIDVAAKVKDQLLKYGRVRHARLGVTIQEVNQDLATSFGLDRPAGALVSSVEKGSPAARAGIEPGDVIVKFNGREIGTSGDLPPLVANMEPGTTVTLGIMRRGSYKEVNATLSELQTSTVASADNGTAPRGRLGLVVRSLAPEEKKSLGVEGGVVVEEATGPAANAGIRPGDVVLSVNGTPVRNVEQLQSAIEKSGKVVALLVQRNDTKLFIPVRAG